MPARLQGKQLQCVRIDHERPAAVDRLVEQPARASVETQSGADRDGIGGTERGLQARRASHGLRDEFRPAADDGGGARRARRDRHESGAGPQRRLAREPRRTRHRKPADDEHASVLAFVRRSPPRRQRGRRQAPIHATEHR